MAKIFYGVQADAGGHIARSHAIAHQLKGHEIVFAGGERVASLRRYGYDTVTIPMLETVVRDGRLDLAATLRETARVLAGARETIRRLGSVIEDFAPDLILSDFEFFVPHAARRIGRACISVDRQHFVTNCVYPTPPGGHVARAMFMASLRATRMNASRYFVVSFLDTLASGRWPTEVFPPVIRPEILALEAWEGDHALAYLHFASLDWIRRNLSGRKQRFIVYGHDHEADEGNLLFRRRDADRFAQDLAGARYVVSHAGHNVIGECLHLHKPLLCFPSAGLYEQHVNAHLLAAEGLGASANSSGAPAALDRFEQNLDRLRARLATHGLWTGRSLPSRLFECLKSGAAEFATNDSTFVANSPKKGN